MLKGIDISYCQKGLDLAKAKAEGVQYVIIRAGVAERKDTEFDKHISGAIQAGLPYGFYWYSRAFNVASAKNEAKACLNTIRPYKPVYPVYYDMEQKDQINGLDNNTRTAIITAFCDAVKKGGFTPGVYINPSWMNNYVKKSALIGKYDIWLAHWTGSPSLKSHYDFGQRMQQWGTDRICGMKVDGDICNYDYENGRELPSDSSAAAGST